jgi:hypothetical protein
MSFLFSPAEVLMSSKHIYVLSLRTPFLMQLVRFYISTAAPKLDLVRDELF